RPRICDPGVDVLLQIGDALDAVGQVRDQVGAALQIVFDLRPTVVNLIPLCDQAVVSAQSPASDEQRQQHDRSQNNQPYFSHCSLLLNSSAAGNSPSDYKLSTASITRVRQSR